MAQQESTREPARAGGDSAPHAYEKPQIEELGGLVELTAGSKFNSFADLQNGQSIENGPGS